MSQMMLQFYVGQERFGLDVSQVVEVVPLVTLKPARRAPAYVLGFLDYRGGVAPVIDLTALISDTPSRAWLSTRIILVDYEGADGKQHVLGLLAERATETIVYREDDFQPPGFAAGDARFLGDVLLDAQGMNQRIRVKEILPPAVQESLFATVT